MWQYDRPTSSDVRQEERSQTNQHAGTTSNSDAPEWRGEWVALLNYENILKKKIQMSKFCLPVEVMELMINYGKKNLCNKG